jgi:hypothetical protein
MITEVVRTAHVLQGQDQDQDQDRNRDQHHKFGQAAVLPVQLVCRLGMSMNRT